MKDPHCIIVQPHITEKTVALSYGDASIKDESKVVRSYTFIVAGDANKIEIKSAIETIYNEGRRADQAIVVANVRTVTMHGKMKRRGMKSRGLAADRKKAVVTLAKGQVLEDYGV